MIVESQIFLVPSQQASPTPIWDDLDAENTGFKTADYSERLYSDIEREVHMDRGFTKGEKRGGDVSSDPE